MEIDMKRLTLLLFACSLLSIDTAPSCHAQTRFKRYDSDSNLRFQPQSSGLNRYRSYDVRPFRPTFNPRIRRYPWWRLNGSQSTLRLARGIDPAAHAIQFRVLSRSTQFRGRVEISATLKNVGTSAYQSRAGAQAAYLYETPLGSRNKRLVTSRDFTQLNPGQEVKLTYIRNWDRSSPAEGEFPPTYELKIVYDPDIAIDGNPQNDDANRGNNQRTRSGTAINQLFR
jgi:hypothetical protein